MENKETKEETYWLPISLLFILIIGIGVIIFYLDKPEFKITKEECWNETTLDSLSEAGCIINSSWDNDQFNITIVCPQCYGENCNLNFEEKVCKQVEVDKEYVDNLPINEEIIINLALLTYFDIGNKEGWFSEWLGENCECIGGVLECKGVEGDSPIGNFTWSNCEYIKCKKYKCGEYFVEVK